MVGNIVECFTYGFFFLVVSIPLGFFHFFFINIIFWLFVFFAAFHMIIHICYRKNSNLKRDNFYKIIYFLYLNRKFRKRFNALSTFLGSTYKKCMMEWERGGGVIQVSASNCDFFSLQNLNQNGIFFPSNCNCH